MATAFPTNGKITGYCAILRVNVKSENSAMDHVWAPCLIISHQIQPADFFIHLLLGLHILLLRAGDALKIKGIKIFWDCLLR